MGRFNLLEEEWISVTIDKKGKSKDVSLIEVFENSHEYLGLAGDSKTQDFAVMRFLLAVLHTVFSRFDDEGNPYKEVDLDENFRQINEIEEDYIFSYSGKLFDTWENLWNKGQFPQIVNDYLKKWEDRFYLFDEKYPFYQVPYEEISGGKIKKKSGKPGKIHGKNINRTISESQNKTSLFAPKYSKNKAKDKLTYGEIARWLITFQGYTGLADKTRFAGDDYKKSKGWLFDLGGVYLEGSNLFETLMLNLVLDRDRIDDGENNRQKPCWEYSGAEIIERAFDGLNPDNLSELYTNWSRSVNIDPDFKEGEAFFLYAVKMPNLDHKSYFLEPMTIWNFNKQGDNKDSYTPRKHRPNQALWRSFGLLVTNSPESTENRYKKPGIMIWLEKIKDVIGQYYVSVNSISMQDDGNSTSWKPTDETYDSLNTRQFILTDMDEGEWTPTIRRVVDETKRVISFRYKNYLDDIALIRNDKSGSFVNKNVEKMYFLVDRPFRDWLSSIKFDDDKDDKVFEWRFILYKLVSTEAKKIFETASPRDYRGRVVKRKIKKVEKEILLNIAVAYNNLDYSIKSDMKIRGMKDGSKEK